MQEAGGEFACWLLAGEYLLFFNDWLGRLPVYRYHYQQQLFIGRSLQVLFQQVPKRPDPLGLAQYLWAGYSIGQRTIFQHVAPVAPGSTLLWHLPTGSLVQQQAAVLPMDQYNDGPKEAHAARLHELFLAACRRLQTTGPNNWHLSLSGGQDSKAVLAGMQQAGARLHSSSFLLPGAECDVQLANALAARASVPWQLYTIAKDCHTNLQWLIQLKQGLNYSGMAFIKCYLQQVAAAHAGATLLTGDGGDVILPYLGEASTPRSADHLVRTLLRRHAIASPTMAAAVAGVGPYELAQSIYDLIATYPEADRNDQSVHFAFCERIGKAYFEGEDRNRYFMWCTTPFYDPALVKAAMAVPQAYKRNYRLYYQWLLLLCPDWAHLPDAGGGRPGSWYFHSRKWVRENFRSTPPAVKSSLRLLNKWLQPSAGTAAKAVLPLPRGLHAICNETAWRALASRGGQETYLYLQTLSNVFS
jgi:asparagine synthase (glutamine-hydrolysing)